MFQGEKEKLILSITTALHKKGINTPREPGQPKLPGQPGGRGTPPKAVTLRHHITKTVEGLYRGATKVAPITFPEEALIKLPSGAVIALPRATSARSLAQLLTPEAIQVLADVACNPTCKPIDRVAAASAILDRGWGKPVSPMVYKDVTAIPDDELEAMVKPILKARGWLGASSPPNGGDPSGVEAADLGDSPAEEDPPEG